MDERLIVQMVRDELWQIAQPLTPPQQQRRHGGGTQHRDERTVRAAIVYVLTPGCTCRQAPAGTCRRRPSECPRPPPTLA